MSMSVTIIEKSGQHTSLCMDHFRSTVLGAILGDGVVIAGCEGDKRIIPSVSTHAFGKAVSAALKSGSGIFIDMASCKVSARHP